jgi:putative sterol carrier protein
MSRFLSEEWVTELTAALASDDARTQVAGVDLTLQQIVTGSPDGEVSFWISLADEGVSGGLGRASAPDVTLTMDHETARALSRAELNHQAAFMQGKLTVTGNMGKLLKHQQVLKMFAPVMSEVATEY